MNRSQLTTEIESRKTEAVSHMGDALDSVDKFIAICKRDGTNASQKDLEECNVDFLNASRKATARLETLVPV